MLCHRLGLVVVVRDPATSAVLAASPDAVETLLVANPGLVRVASGELAGVSIRVEIAQVGAGDAIDLTPRQSAVAALLGEGLRNREIAARLLISTHTVRRHVESILRRLQVANRSAAAKEVRAGRVRIAR